MSPGAIASLVLVAALYGVAPVSGAAATVAVPAPVTLTPVVERPAAPPGTPVAPTELTPYVADFNGDVRTDTLWYGPGDIQDHLWLGRADRTFDGAPISVPGTYAPVVGDFDGDRRADVLWYAAGPGADVLWYGRASGRFTPVSVTVNGVYTPVVGDFDGNGRADILWYGPGPARDVLWLAKSTGRGFAGVVVSVPGIYRPVVGDFDGDHAQDIVWYGAGSAPDALWLGRPHGAFVERSLSVLGTYEPVVGDFNGDRRRDVLWYGAAAARDALWYGAAGGGFTGRSVDIATDGVPVGGDFDANGTRDVLVYGAGGARDAAYYGRATGGFTTVGLGLGHTYRPVGGDFDADRHGDVFWYQPGNAFDKIGFGAGRSFAYRTTTIDIGFTRAAPLQLDAFVHSYSPYGVVAHEMGGINGNTYTNSLDAFLYNYDRGFRVFESDQVILGDGTVLLAHDGLERSYGLDKPFGEATWADVAGHKFNGKYTILRAQDLLELMRDYPDTYIILDFKDDPATTFRKYVALAGGDPALIERLFPHVPFAANLRAMRLSYPVQNYVVSLYNSQYSNHLDDPEMVDWARRDRVPSVMMWKGQRDWTITLAANHRKGQRYDDGFVADLRAAGTISYVHTNDDPNRGMTFMQHLVGMYTNVLFPPFVPSPTPTVSPPLFDPVVAQLVDKE